MATRRTLLLSALVVRVLLLYWADWQDQNWAVHYTDIDYDVVTDGARAIAAGGSPYDRATYRYTPLLAWLALPNLWLRVPFLKIIYSAGDLVAAWLMGRILQHPRLAGPKDQKWVTIGMGLWLFSPLTAVISTRGSGESLVTCLILGMLYGLLNDRIVPAALCLGLAVHWRLYPIMYGLPILRFLAAQSRRQPRSVLNELCSQRGFLFGTVSGITFLALGLGCWSAYGHQFLEEAFLYHLKRTDPRHNFSPYFLSAYLASSSHLSSAYSIGRAFSFAQLVLTAVLGWTGNNNVVGAMFLQTIAFVTVNKVCTAQYFVWYFSFLPLVLPQLATSTNKWKIVTASAGWAAAACHWLLWAYALEFWGWAVHIPVWVASLIFMAANTWLLSELTRAFASRRKKVS